MTRKFHEVANIFPLMTGEEFAALKADIAENGQREAIWLHPDGSIIDGRNRYNACIELGIEPHYRTWKNEGSLVSFVVSLNLHRRHLTTTQRAVLSVDILPMLEAEARERMAEAGRSAAPGKPVKELTPFEVEVEPQRASQQAATILSTNRQYVSDAKRIAQDAPEVLEMMRVGVVNMPAAKQLAQLENTERAAVLEEMKGNGVSEIDGREVQKAVRQIRHQQKQEAPPIPTNKYRVWYADPPWEYGNSGVIGDGDNYGHAQRHYPTMSIAELCAMGADIKANCADDAVLFMWVTSPLLEECFPVINAWGFKYKTSFVWDKVGHNYGHYNSVRHELLLVCTRGSCTPDDKTLHDSVISIEKSRKHSEKPEEFRALIDSLYKWGNRIELFARTSAEGWDSWGNE